MRSVRRSSGFTLIELLVVIAIIAILVGLAVPALKNFGRSNTLTSATRQLLDDIGRARQLAVTHRTTVYMVFVTTNFWNHSPQNPVLWFNDLSPADRTLVTNLCDNQVSGYNFLALGQLGDQPGRHSWHYLSSWQSMPEGAYISIAKFNPTLSPQRIITWEQDYNNGQRTDINCFTNSPLVPFPSDAATNYFSILPCLAFDYTGRLISEVGPGGNYVDAYIPISQGIMAPARNGSSKMLQLASPDVHELPAGNTTNIAYNVIHIDALTGRATQEYHKVQ